MTRKKIDGTDERAKENAEIFLSYRSAQLHWATDAWKFDNFRHGTQYSQKEVQDLNKFRQAPLPVNVTTAICDMAEAMLTAGSPTISVMPASYQDEEKQAAAKQVAYKYRELLMASWRNSQAGMVYDRIIRDYLDVGRGHALIMPEWNHDEYSCRIKRLAWWKVYPDPSSESPFYDDADNVIVSYMVTAKQAAMYIKRMFKEDVSPDDLANSNTQGLLYRDESLSNQMQVRYAENKYSTFRDRQRRFVNVIMRYSLEEQTIYELQPQSGMTPMHHRKVTELTSQIKQFAADGVVKPIARKGYYLTLTFSVGDFVHKEFYPIETYPIVPLHYDHRDNPYPISFVSYIYPIQRALNKTVMLMLLNATLLNSTKVIAEKGTIYDKDHWLTNASVPGVQLEYEVRRQGSVPPTIIEAKPLHPAFLQLPEWLKSLMEYISGISMLSMGFPQPGLEVFHTVSALQNAGGLKMKRRQQNIDVYLSRIGKTVASFYEHMAPLNGMAHYRPDGSNDYKEVRYNRPMPHPTDPRQVVIDPSTNLGLGLQDVEFISYASQGWERANQIAMFTTLATQLKLPELVPIIVSLMDLPEADKVADQMKQKNDMQQMLAQASQKIQQLEQVNQMLAQKAQGLMEALEKEKIAEKGKDMIHGLEKKIGMDLSSYAQNFDANNAGVQNDHSTIPDAPESQSAMNGQSA